MRQIAIDRTRARLAAKRGGGLNPLDLEDWIVADEDLGRSLLALDTALDDLAARDPRLAAMVELRFFVGMSVKETAASLGVTGRTVKRGWRLARAFLCARMDEAEFGAEVSSSGAGASGKSPTARRPARPGRKPPDR
jgi:RNA polymerase sigma factor (TIGR02999 family)